MIRKVRKCCEACENLVCVATTIGQLQHSEYLKPTFLDTFKWAIRPVFPETVTNKFAVSIDPLHPRDWNLLFLTLPSAPPSTPFYKEIHELMHQQLDFSILILCLVDSAGNEFTSVRLTKDG